MTPRTSSSSDGFTILEALVALVVLTAALVAVSVGLSGSWQGIAASERETRAIALAQSELAKAGHTWPLERGRHAARTPDGFDISVVAEPANTPQVSAPTGTPRLYRVEVSVSWRRALKPGLGAVTLETFKLEDPL